MTAITHFSASYGEGRQKFLDAAKAAGAAITTHSHPGRGPDGGALATDVAHFGEKDAPNLFIATSATHGIEGFCGSGSMVGWMAEGLVRERPKGTAILLVHALNPHGFAHERRVTEDNVDLNRNFVDHARPYPVNAGYADLHAHLVPSAWDGAPRQTADQAIAAYIARHGHGAYQAAVTQGQYSHVDGLFFGGTAPTWSNRTWREILKTHAARRRHVAVLDFHTGLGPRGYGEIHSERGPNDPEYLRLQSWFDGEATSPDDGSSSSAAISGYMASAVAEECPDAVRSCFAVEYGTRPLDQVLDAVRADNWLYARGKVDSPLGRTIKRAIRDAFYGEDERWKTDVFERAVSVARKTLRGLAGS